MSKGAPMHETMAGWLHLHGVTAQDLRRLVRHAVPARAPPAAMGAAIPEPGHCRDLALAALSVRFPGAAPFLQGAAARWHWRIGAQGALALVHPQTGVPIIACPWSNRVEDWLTLAHECGHGIQIVASAGQSVAPILREMAAMASEQALVDYLYAVDHDAAPDLDCALARLAARQIAAGEALLRQLTQADSPYNYAWNYPAARCAIHAMGAAGLPLAAVIEGRADLAALIAHLRLPD